MEQTNLYKEEYLKYKKNYLVLKNQISGRPKLYATYYHFMIILNAESYETIKRMINHEMLSLNKIRSELRGCALEINDVNPNIVFNRAYETSSDISKYARRKSGMSLDVVSPEYRYKKPEEANYDNIIGKINHPYKHGCIFTHAEFITSLATTIVEKLQRRNVNFARDNDPSVRGSKHLDFHTYSDILPSEAFYGIMIFRTTETSCHHLQSFLLMKADESNSNAEDSSLPDDKRNIKINLVANLISSLMEQDQKTGYMLKQDNTVIDPRSHFLNIVIET